MSTIAVDNFKPPSGGTSFGASGIAKATCLYNQLAPTITRSTNVCSITDNGLGDWTANFTAYFTAGDYIVNSSGHCQSTGGTCGGAFVGIDEDTSPTAGSFEGASNQASTGSLNAIGGDKKYTAFLVQGGLV